MNRLLKEAISGANQSPGSIRPSWRKPKEAQGNTKQGKKGPVTLHRGHLTGGEVVFSGRGERTGVGVLLGNGVRVTVREGVGVRETVGVRVIVGVALAVAVNV
jgi:hypothetical protein